MGFQQSVAAAWVSVCQPITRQGSTGDPRRIEELRYDEVRKLDVGRWFAPSFAGERVCGASERFEDGHGWRAILTPLGHDSETESQHHPSPTVKDHFDADEQADDPQSRLG